MLEDHLGLFVALNLKKKKKKKKKYNNKKRKNEKEKDRKLLMRVEPNLSVYSLPRPDTIGLHNWGAVL